jgi:hypothetical protein
MQLFEQQEASMGCLFWSWPLESTGRGRRPNIGFVLVNLAGAYRYLGRSDSVRRNPSASYDRLRHVSAHCALPAEFGASTQMLKRFTLDLPRSDRSGGSCCGMGGYGNA